MFSTNSLTINLWPVVGRWEQAVCQASNTRILNATRKNCPICCSPLEQGAPMNYGILTLVESLDASFTICGFRWEGRCIYGTPQCLSRVEGSLPNIRGIPSNLFRMHKSLLPKVLGFLCFYLNIITPQGGYPKKFQLNISSRSKIIVS